jgi:hypothetical protein
MDPAKKKTSRRPNTFWRLTFDTGATQVKDTEDYDFDPGKFDYLQLIQGTFFKGNLPPDVRLRLAPGKKPLADYPGNPLGWPIMSKRLVKALWPFIKDSVQLIPALLYERNSVQLVTGYSIVNVLKILDCIDVSRSVPWYDGKRLGGFDEMCIDPERTNKEHIFHCRIPPKGVDYGVTCSYDLVKSLVGKHFTGMAFLRCRAPDD